MPVNAATQELEIHHNIPFVESGAEIDGIIMEGEWEGAEQVRLVNETHPSENVDAPVDTDVLMMEDGLNFYLAFIAYDPEPEKIRAFYRDRDSSWEDDFVGVVIDTFNDERRAFEFFANALGVQMDLIFDDVIRNEDSSWNAIWDSAGEITEEGYIVEMKIPLDQLRFKDALEKQTWGIDLLRFYPRNRRHRISNNHADYDRSCYLCTFNKAQGFSNLEQNLNLQLVPTFTASYAMDRPSPDDSWRKDFKPEGGLDVRWGINQNSYLHATYNPDFSQVEADVAQLNVNNTFSLFFPERREFFLDGKDYFNTQNNLVHTRNISAPDYGMKLTGKHNVHTYGLFFANDVTTNFLIPGNQGSSIASLGFDESINTVLRYRRDISDNINVGLIGTDRRASDYSNTVAGVDGSIRLGDSDRINVQVLQSFSRYPESIQDEHDQKAKLDDHAYQVNYQHNDSEWFWRAMYARFGDEFRADMGFINKVDYKQALVGGGHTWRFDSDRRFNRISVEGDIDKTWDESGKMIEQEIEGGINAEGPWQSYFYIGGGLRERFFDGEYFDENFFILFGRVRPRAGMTAGAEIFGGDTIDFANTRLGNSITFSPFINMYIGKHLQVNLQHNYQRLDVGGRKLFTTNLTDLRITYQFNVRSFLRATIQYSDTRRTQSLYLSDVDHISRNMTTQLLYSYKINPQTRFFVGYSDTGFQDDELGSIKKTNHTIFTKFSYAWQY